MLGGSYAASTFLGRAIALRTMLMTSSSSAYSVCGLASLALVPQVRLDSAGGDDDTRPRIRCVSWINYMTSCTMVDRSWPYNLKLLMAVGILAATCGEQNRESKTSARYYNRMGLNVTLTPWKSTLP